MKIPERHILEEAFRGNYPDAIVQAIRTPALQEGRLLAARALSEAWLRQHNGLDRHGVALFIRQQMTRQAGNE